MSEAGAPGTEGSGQAPGVVLVCTVGGSHEPVVRAIQTLQPIHVCFVCTGRDPATGRQGSETQVTGRGAVIRARGEDRPSLPSIPAQVGLLPQRYQVVLVPADDLDAAFQVISAALDDLARRFPAATIHADYTGGTKSMTAALVMAAFEAPRVRLGLVTGARADLVAVRGGTEQVAHASVANIRLRRAMAPHLAAWQRFAYAEAAAGLGAVAPPDSEALRARLQRARDLSAAFAAWDAFDHRQALALLDPYRPRVARDLDRHLAALGALLREGPRREPHRLLDLWLNAERRAAQGRFDDAVARIYRLIEWTAQWLLRARAGLDTADLPPERVPAETDLRPGRDGRIQAGLYAAWDLLARELPDTPAGRFFTEEHGALLHHLAVRNRSILAHGYEPIREDEWTELKGWLDEHFVPVLEAETREAGVRSLPPQLPVDYIWCD